MVMELLRGPRRTYVCLFNSKLQSIVESLEKVLDDKGGKNHESYIYEQSILQFLLELKD